MRRVVKVHDLLRDKARRFHGRRLLLDDLAAAHPSVSKIWADGGYQNSIFNHGAILGIDVEVVQRPRAKGFDPLPKRWVIERPLGWLMEATDRSPSPSRRPPRRPPGPTKDRTNGRPHQRADLTATDGCAVRSG
ncbi:hypothetical protein ACFYO5_23580 [Streptomyces sp. NPDC006259]|uniref:hypothetical protein n=1 Tax=Streptomyces sp. NPDC006259 TaxID=3364740 RepID=UPI0036A7F8C9